MDEKDTYGNIEKYSLLLQKYFDGQLTSGERSELAEWLWRDRRNRELLRRLRGGNMSREKYRAYQRIDIEREFELLTHRYKKTRKRKFVIRWSGVAAILVLALCVGLLFDREVKPEGRIVVKEGKVQAVLTTADGSVIPIKKGMIKPGIETFQIKDSLKELFYEPVDRSGDSVRYHRLDVPRGGEYTLVLADGSCAFEFRIEYSFPGVFFRFYQRGENRGRSVFRS